MKSALKITVLTGFVALMFYQVEANAFCLFDCETEKIVGTWQCDGENGTWTFSDNGVFSTKTNGASTGWCSKTIYGDMKGSYKLSGKQIKVVTPGVLWGTNEVFYDYKFIDKNRIRLESNPGMMADLASTALSGAPSYRVDVELVRQ